MAIVHGGCSRCGKLQSELTRSNIKVRIVDIVDPDHVDQTSSINHRQYCAECSAELAPILDAFTYKKRIKILKTK